MTAPSVAPSTSSDLISDVISSAFGQTMTDTGTAETDLVRDERGRFVPRGDASDFTTDQDGAPDPEATPVPAAKPDGKPVELPAKDGEPVVLPVADPATLATAFVLKDATGALEIPAGLLIEFSANGKARTEPLDKVVKFAQMGVYNHEREQRTQLVQQQAEETQQYASQIEARLRTREEQMEMLLADPAFRERAIQEYEAQHTPEAQSQRLAREREEFRIEQERTDIRRSGDQYYKTEIVPSLDLLAASVPHVSADEIKGKFEAFVNRQRDHRTGLVPPSKYQDINQHFLTVVIPWAQSLDDYRATERGTPSGRQTRVESTATDAKAKADLEAANLRAQKARRIATANLKPPGRGANAPVPKKTPTTREEVMEDIIASTKAAMGAGA